MVYRTVICVLLFGVVGVGLACGLFAQEKSGSPPPEPSGSRVQGTSSGERPPPAAAAPPSPVIDRGLASVEFLSVATGLIVKARLGSITPDAMTDEDGGHLAILKFNFTVSEHLKGTSPTNIVGIWIYAGRHGYHKSAETYATSAEAESVARTQMAARDTQWDDREAIIFLNTATQKSIREGEPGLGEYLKEPNHYLMSFGYHYPSSPDDDGYSLYSNGRRGWLPSTDSGGGSASSGDKQEFLLAIPEALFDSNVTPIPGIRRTGKIIPPGGDVSNGRTITLGALKGIISTVMAEYNGGDGSEEHKRCVLQKYDEHDSIRNWPTIHGKPYTALGILGIGLTVDSGQAAGTRVGDFVFDDAYEEVDTVYNIVESMWLTGTDAMRFEAFNVPWTPIDEDDDGTFDIYKTEYGVKTARPLPGGSYEFTVHELRPNFAVCDFAIEHVWTVTVTTSRDVLHELFFDPVAVGSTVAADSTNGVLKPAAFTDGNGASATVGSISYEAGTVGVEVTPDGALAGQVLDFIELDGTVSLSLDVADATVDAGISTLSWSVESQPWEDGDMLMVRIREAR